MPSPRIERAIISVSDKTGLAEFARSLAAAGVRIYSTGGTRRHLAEAGVPTEDVSAYTGFPEMMDGRVKTLHPKIHGGILCRRDRPDDVRAMREHGIHGFELVVVNLYPFQATIAKAGVTRDEAIEQIDIGGPALVRAAAKNHAFVTVATDPAQYPKILEELAADGATSIGLRSRLAATAFQLTAEYDRAVAEYLSPGEAVPEDGMPARLDLSLGRNSSLRYGENPHQPAALYAEAGMRNNSLVAARQLSGKELSYNNYLDLDSALAIVRALPRASVAVIKHNNPCGAAMADTAAAATRAALDGDPVSAFGSVLGFNTAVDAAAAEVLVEPERFIEAIVAPRFDPAALEMLTTRPKWKANVRLLELGEISNVKADVELRRIDGGYLAQRADVLADDEGAWQVVTKTRPSDGQMADLRFAWQLVRWVKSNAIVLASDRALIGVGAGQMSRVDSVQIAIQKAADRARGAVLGSDAFFPFADSIERAAAAGVTAIIQPGGSRRDDEVTQACDKLGLAMIMTGRRHFRH